MIVEYHVGLSVSVVPVTFDVKVANADPEVAVAKGAEAFVHFAAYRNRKFLVCRLTIILSIVISFFLGPFEIEDSAVAYDHAAAVVATVCVNTSAKAVASVAFRSTLVNVDTVAAVVLITVTASAFVSAFSVDTVSVGAARMFSGLTFVDVETVSVGHFVSHCCLTPVEFDADSADRLNAVGCDPVSMCVVVGPCVVDIRPTVVALIRPRFKVVNYISEAIEVEPVSFDAEIRSAKPEDAVGEGMEAVHHGLSQRNRKFHPDRLAVGLSIVIVSFVRPVKRIVTTVAEDLAVAHVAADSVSADAV